MRICVPTIRHSGTRLMTQMMLKAGLRGGNPFNPDSTKYPCFFVGHVNGESYKYMMRVSRTCKVMSPMRHPARIWKSFKDRDMSMELFKESWNNFMIFYREYHMPIVHVDSELRDEQLLVASKHVGLPLITEWPTDSSDCGNHSIGLTDDMISEIPHHIMGYYEELLNG